MRGDQNVEALPYKQVSRSASEPLPLRLVTPIKIHAASVSFVVERSGDSPRRFYRNWEIVEKRGQPPEILSRT